MPGPTDGSLQIVADSDGGPSTAVIYQQISLSHFTGIRELSFTMWWDAKAPFSGSGTMTPSGSTYLFRVDAVYTWWGDPLIAVHADPPLYHSPPGDPATSGPTNYTFDISNLAQYQDVNVWLRFTVVSYLPELLVGIDDIRITNRHDIFDQVGATLPGTSYSSVDWADVDADGDFDLVLPNGANHQLYLNSPSGFSASTVTVPVGNSIQFSDADNDNDIDLFVGRSGETRVWYNDGGLFPWYEPIVPSEVIVNPSISVGDFGNDGSRDVLISGTAANPQLAEGDVMLRRTEFNGATVAGPVDSYSRFGDRCQIGARAQMDRAVQLADLDGDGVLDYVLTGTRLNNLGVEAMYAGIELSANSCTIAQQLAPAWYTSVAVGDIDSDGDLDVVIAGDNQDLDPAGGTPIIKVFRNEGGGVFVDNGDVLVNSGDNDLDIVMTGNAGTRVYRNVSRVVNERP